MRYPFVVHLGIDLGTTLTQVAFADRGNYPVLSFTAPSGEAYEGFPSLVAERAGELMFGLEALEAADDPSTTVVRSWKRWLSLPETSPDAVVEVGSVELPLVDLVTRFLEALRQGILERSNLPRAVARKSPDMSAVVATPANALGTQRFLTLEAFRRAGFSVRGTLNEPSAAGFDYAHRHAATLTSRREHIVVYDLGGGTFDASLVAMTGAAHDVLATAGAPRLGGDDFDEVLLGMVTERGRLDDLETRARAALLNQCRDAKERLGPNARRIVIEPEGGPVVTIPVADYYAACAPLIERSVDAMLPVMDRLEEQTARDAMDELAGIYVVGGASALPPIVRTLRARFGRRVHRSPSPSSATAIGLAIACDEVRPFRLTDRFSRHFGVFREDRGGTAACFDAIFTRDTPLPSSEDRVVVGERVYQAAHNLGHFRFVECARLDASGAPAGDVALTGDVLFPFLPALQGERDLTSVAVERLPAQGPMIKEEYALDERGLVALTITDLQTGHAREFQLGSSAARKAGRP